MVTTTEHLALSLATATSSVQETQDKLKQLVDAETKEYKRLQFLNRNLGLGLGISAIALSLGAAIAGIVSDNAKLSAVLATCAASVQSVLFAYPVDKRAGFYRSLAGRSQNLFDELHIKPLTEEQLYLVLEKVEAIRLEASVGEPQTTRTEEHSASIASQSDHHSSF